MHYTDDINCKHYKQNPPKKAKRRCNLNLNTCDHVCCNQKPSSKKDQ
jgi:hypothetical protein